MEAIKILLIDDEQSTYDIVSHYCKRNKNYNIELQWLDGIPNDLSTIDANHYALLLLDFYIHDRTGLEVLKILGEHNQDELARLPVIMLSSSTDIQDAAKAVHYGISEFIPKATLTEEILNHKINDVIYKNQLKISLIETNRKLAITNQILLQKGEEITNFYQVVSHELKTPLTSTYEFINIMLDGLAGKITDEQREYLNICRRNCQQLTQYMNDLLDIGRMASNKYKLNKECIDVNEVVNEVIQTSRVISHYKNIKLQFIPATSGFYIYADRVRIYQALLILLNNATKFSPPNEVIEIKVEVDPTKTSGEVTVIDHGCGIAKEHQERIFDRLFQINPLEIGSKAGLGLGLFICREIVLLHDGAISVDSTPGKGSQFRVQFPYYHVSKDAHEKNTYS